MNSLAIEKHYRVRDYQARVAGEKIRFVIKQAEQIGGQPDEPQEIGSDLLVALDRIESIDRRFQGAFHCSETGYQLHGTGASLGFEHKTEKAESLR